MYKTSGDGDQINYTFIFHHFCAVKNINKYFTYFRSITKYTVLFKTTFTYLST